MRPAREQLKCSGDWKRLLTATYGPRGLWTGRWRIIVVQDSQFDFSDTSRTQNISLQWSSGQSFSLLGTGYLMENAGILLRPLHIVKICLQRPCLGSPTSSVPNTLPRFQKMRKVIGKPIADWLQVQVSHFIVMHTIICISVPVICDVYLHLSTCQSIYRLFDSYREYELWAARNPLARVLKCSK